MKDSPFLKLRLFSLALVFPLAVFPASAKGGSPAAPATWVELGESGAIIAPQAIPLGPTGPVQTFPAIPVARVRNPPATLSLRNPPPPGLPFLVSEVLL